MLLFNQDSNYGVDWDGPLTTEEDDAVIVPEIGCPLSDADYSLLQETIPQDVSTALSDGSYGIDTYMRVRSFVQSCIEHY